MIYTANRGETMDDLLMRLGLDYCDETAVGAVELRCGGLVRWGVRAER